MIAIQHRQFSFDGIHRRDEQVVVDLDFDRPQLRRDFATQSFAVDNVSTFHDDDFALGDVGFRK